MSFITILKFLPYIAVVAVVVYALIMRAKVKGLKKDKLLIQMECDYEKEKSERIIENMDQILDYTSDDERIKTNALKHVKELKEARSEKTTKIALDNLRSDLYNTYHAVKL